jgi:TRAP-type transport system periplasmic protein
MSLVSRRVLLVVTHVAVGVLAMRSAAGDSATLRIATIIPDGTGWARELRAMGRDVESASLQIKWYMGGIAGDELESLERVRRGQLDGIVSAGMACERIAPSLRVTRIPGLFQSWDETSSIIARLKPVLDSEAQRNGYVNLGEAVVGPSIVFSRDPIGEMQDLGKARLWIWDIDEVLKAFLPIVGVRTEALPIVDAARAYEQGRVSGFITPATAALGFRWSAQVKYYVDLRMGFVTGCLLLATRAFDALPLATKQHLKSATAKAQNRFEAVGRAQERELLAGLFRRQGLMPLEVNDTFRALFLEKARVAREQLPDALLDKKLVARVLGMLADFRAEHAR